MGSDKIIIQGLQGMQACNKNRQNDYEMLLARDGMEYFMKEFP